MCVCVDDLNKYNIGCVIGTTSINQTDTGMWTLWIK